MRCKEVIRLCVKRKKMVVYRDGEDQWLSDGVSAYRISGIPHLDGDGVPRLFDIPWKKWEKMTFSVCDGLPGNLCFEDFEDGERELEISARILGGDGECYLAVKTRKGVYFINEADLKPIETDGYTKILERTNAHGDIYFAIREGLRVSALISSVNMATDEMAENFREIAFGLQKVARETRGDVQMEIGGEEEE